MNIVVLYLIFLKATISAFSGLAALPILRDELVVNRSALSDEQMNTALVAGRVSPGPIGMYVVSVGYYVAGLPGAAAAWLALATPALVVVPLLRYVGARAEHPAVRQGIDAVVIASVGLTLATLIPMASTGIDDWLTGTAAMAGVLVLLYRNRLRA